VRALTFYWQTERQQGKRSFMFICMCMCFLATGEMGSASSSVEDIQTSQIAQS
jgi:hypothetical protein